MSVSFVLLFHTLLDFNPEHLPRLFLKKEEDYEKLIDLIVLKPHWLMSIMKNIMELSMSKPKQIPNADIRRLEKSGVADLKLLKACWKEDLPTSVTLDQLCFIIQAYCLIFPLQRESDEVAQEYIIPCMLPSKFDGEDISKLSTTFYFDFQSFLPDEIYYKLIGLLSTRSNSRGNCYSKLKCSFHSVCETNWIIEHEEEKQRIKVMVM